MMRGVRGRVARRTVPSLAGLVVAVLVSGLARPGLAADGIVASPATTPAVRAAPAGAVRSAELTARGEDHANFGRIDIEADSQSRYRIERNGDHVSIRFDVGRRVVAPAQLPRNVLAAKAVGAILELTLVHGAALHPLRVAGHVVFDIYDVPNAAKPGTPEPIAAAHPAEAPAASAAKVATAPRMPVKQEAEPSVAAAGGTVPGGPPGKVGPLGKAVAAAAGLATSPELGGRLARLPDPAPAPQATPPLPAPAAPAAPPVAEATVVAVPAAADAAAEGAVAADTKPIAMSTDEKGIATGRDVLPGPDAPAGLIGRQVRLPPEVEGTAVLLPFDGATGAAAFEIGDTTYVVFDQRRSVSLSLLQKDPVFGGMTMRLLPAATLFQVKLPPHQTLALARVPQGWRLLALATAPRRQQIQPTPEKGRVQLAADLPGSVISLADPDTGATLLIGTQRRPGQGVAIQRRTGEFILRQAIQGVVVEPLADSIQMQTTKQGFTLFSSAGPLKVSPITPATQASIAAAHLTRTLDLPMMRPETVFRRLERQFLDAGATPPLSRGPVHRAAAESLVSLGFAAEADSLLRTVAAQDPQVGAQPSTEALMGITALLAGRPNEADSLNDPRLNGIDEIDFWRAVRQAMADEGSPAAAAVFATTGPIVMAYPKPITDHFLPLVVETMLLGGEIQPAARLMDARPDDPSLAYARALRHQADGDTDGALKMLDALTLGRDQFDRFRGAVHAIELRLKTGRIDEVQAADGLNKLSIAWRGDERELALRERVADLRARTGAWRTGLTVLRDAERDFPERQGEIRTRLQDMFGAMMRAGGAEAIPPLDFVSMVDENLDLMPRYDNDPAVQQALLDRLIALDLPERAIPLLRKLLHGATSEIAKARYGATLAAMQVHEGDTADALATLDATETDKAPDDLAEGRILTRASAMAHGGDRDGAIKLLTRLATAAASARRAELLEEVKDWPAAESAWRDSLASTILPDSGLISAAAARTVVRLAAAASRAGDDPGLQVLRETWMKRLPPGPDADAFRLLTGDAVRSTADLGRSAEDVKLAASVAAASGTAAKPAVR